MRAPTDISARSRVSDEERAWLKTFMRIVRLGPKLTRKPDLIDRAVNEKYELGLDLDRPQDPTETQRLAAQKFCDSVSTRRFAQFMRDAELRADFRDFLREIPLVREIFERENAALLSLVDTDPPLSRHMPQAGPEL